MKDFPPRLDTALSNILLLQQRLKMSVRSTVKSIEYRSLVPKEKRDEVERACIASAAEFLHFLSENPSGILAPLHLEQSQIAMVRLLCDACVENADQPLILNESYEAVGSNGPWIFKNYTAGDMHISNSEDVRDWLSAIQIRRFASFHHSFNVNHMFPTDSTIWGFIGMELPKSVDFSFFPTVPTLAELRQRYGNSDDVIVDIYDNGKKYMVKVRYKYDGKQEESINTFSLLGDYVGDETKKRRLVYGNNNGNNTRKEVKKVENRSRASGTVKFQSRS